MAIILRNIIFPRTLLTITIIITTIFCGSFLQLPAVNKNELRIYYLDKLKILKNEVSSFQALCIAKPPLSELQSKFRKLRFSYKKIAVLSEYFHPYESEFLNGPAVERTKEDNPFVILKPHGFQVIEEKLFGKWNSSLYDVVAAELSYGADIVDRMITAPDLDRLFSDEIVFEALSRAVIKMMVLGIAGYDSPIALNAIEESKATVEGIQSVLSFYQLSIEKSSPGAYLKIQKLIAEITKNLSIQQTFNNFDRVYFITKLSNPLYKILIETRSLLVINASPGKRPLKQQAVSIFQPSAFDISFFSPDEQYKVTPERVELGKMLFSDSILSITKNRSCNTCHKAANAFSDGVRVPMALDGKTILKRNTPSLLNTVFQTRQFYDSRTDFLENQLDDVVHNPNEMNGSLMETVEILKIHPVYGRLFNIAYANQKERVTPFNVANAISSYIRSLVFLNSRFDQFMNGDESKMSMTEQKGFNLFMGKAKCGTCHFIPFFNGLLPPDYDETESEVIGVPQSRDMKTIDKDSGKYYFTKSKVDLHSFKTPTIRNIALTPPYMHNGIFKTLQQVIDFYDKGGGSVLKIPPSNMTLPDKKLHLTVKEKHALIAFMKCLTDTTYSSPN